MRFCVDCKNHKVKKSRKKTDVHMCHRARGRAADMITGAAKNGPETCTVERYSESRCGRKARFFEAA